jgi:hypothetical protein
MKLKAVEELRELFEKETGLEYYNYLEDIGDLVPKYYSDWLEIKLTQ